ncbi:PA2928 family protein [Saccharibacillus sp. CPCC 101409]|uniref:PA2928 family protein n=1 Tax=Saccharibacillus sp. CPCC 101409 TaxID=3058041 RepID=UPI0026737154|nr:PA2928 family protein [Saccharibacillus sp. CPCC 101409]MDO3412030.1 PA2928 family protein [Saccharibacillus sp. CPCC 101409]
MEPTLWEKIQLAFRYNDALWHNVFLTVILALAGLFVLTALASLVRSATLPSESRDRRPRRNPLRFLLGWGIGSFSLLAFPIGLFLILSVVLGGSGSARIESGMLSYEQDGRQISVVLADKFIANSTEEGVTRGTSKAFVYALDTADGRPVWKTGIGRSYSPMLLGQTDKRIAVFDGGGPLILDKAGGAVLADARKLQSANSELNGQMPEDAKRYIWQEREKAIVFQGLDGRLYSIDPDTLTGGPMQGAKPADYFGGEAGNAAAAAPQRIGLIRSGGGDKRSVLFLSDEQADTLRGGNFESELPANGAAADPRKRIFAGRLLPGGSSSSEELEPLLETVFLNGGFLSDMRVDSSTASDPYTMTGFPAFGALEKEPVMPELPEPFDWSDMTMDEYLKHEAEQERRMDAYYAERDKYDQAREDYRARQQKYEGAARSILRLNGASSGYPPFHYRNPEAKDRDLFIVLHDSEVSNRASILLSAVDPESGSVLWTADTHLQSLKSCDPSADRLTLVGQGDKGDSYLFTVLLEDGSSHGYDFNYDRSLKF